jgi:hypothetical protein
MVIQSSVIVFEKLMPGVRSWGEQKKVVKSSKPHLKLFIKDYALKQPKYDKAYAYPTSRGLKWHKGLNFDVLGCKMKFLTIATANFI